MEPTDPKDKIIEELADLMEQTLEGGGRRSSRDLCAECRRKEAGMPLSREEKRKVENAGNTLMLDVIDVLQKVEKQTEDRQAAKELGEAADLAYKAYKKMDEVLDPTV